MDQIAPEGHPIYDYSDPEKFGRGAWMRFLLDSRNATSQQERDLICLQIRRFCEYCKCGDCRGHCKTYTRENPPENNKRTNEELFQWFVTFMNAVNKRIGKPLYDIKVLDKIFSNKDIGLCTTACGSHNDVETKQTSESQKHNVTSSYKSNSGVRIIRVIV